MILTSFGMKEWLGSGIIALLIIAATVFLAIKFHSISAWTASALILIVWFGIAMFFRDPPRTVNNEADTIVSPADGVVRDIEVIPGTPDIPSFKGQDMLRVGIFLSVLNVHINRAPCEMTINFRRYKEGHFHDARNPLASKENESMIIAGTGSVPACSSSFPIAVKQISGAIARRIVCPVEAGTRLEKGQKYGMIKFGSRTEIYLPAAKMTEISVNIGDTVRAGTSIIARIHSETEK